MSKGLIKVEKTTRFLLAILGIIIALMFIFVSWGKAEWTLYMGLIGSGFLALFLLTEGAIWEYYRKKDFRKIGLGDIISWLTFGTGVLMIVSFLLLIQIIQNTAPEWLLSFMAVYGTTIGILAGVLFIYHIFTPRPK